MNWTDDKNNDRAKTAEPEIKTDTNAYADKELIGDFAGQELDAGGEILITGAEDPLRDLDINVEPSTTINEPLGADRIVRAIQISSDVVTNVILVAVDKNDKVVGFEVPYGTELVIVEENSEIGPGWVRIDGEFVNPTFE